MKSAISYQALPPEKNANLYVYLELVLREQAVKLLITKKYVPAIIRYKETDMLPVMNVSMNSHDSILFSIIFLAFRFSLHCVQL